MKTILRLLIPALASVLILTSCATTGGDPVTARANLEADAADIAYAGAYYAIHEDAALKDDIRRTAGQLDILATRSTLTAADLLTLLQPLLDQVKELRGPRGAIYITGARIILRRATGQMGIDQTETIKAFVRGLSQGFHAAVD